jgi:hypothetical protein
MNDALIEQLNGQLGSNGLPYVVPIHPNLVHLTLGWVRPLVDKRWYNQVSTGNPY